MNPDHAAELTNRREQMSREMASAYSRTFATDDGKRVLADLRKKFGLDRLSFMPSASGRYDYIAAALTDGERRVMSEIEGAINRAQQF